MEISQNQKSVLLFKVLINEIYKWDKTHTINCMSKLMRLHPLAYWQVYARFKTSRKQSSSDLIQ